MLLVAGLGLLVGLVPAAVRPPAAAAGRAPLAAYRGLGTWVDLYDSLAWGDPAAAVTDMASHGVRTLYLETSNYGSPTALHEPAAMGAFVDACFKAHMKIVAWYLPGFQQPARDLNRSLAAIRYVSPGGHRFTSFALDIEASMVKPVSTRNLRLNRLSTAIRGAVGAHYPLGAIIPSPVGMAKSATYWPKFPYAELAGVYDVMVPMGYYTYHGSGYANAYSDTRNNVSIIREETGDPTIPIHVIAGLAGQSSSTETLAYVRALRENGCLGGSLYDWATTTGADWQVLAAVPVNPVEKPALPVALGYLRPLGNCPGDGTHPKEVFYQAPAQKGAAVLHLRVFDVQGGEVHLLVNWQDVGPLKGGPRGSWSASRAVAIPASLLRVKARNVIGFVAVGASPSWHRWGVRNVTLTAH